jgi:DNA polymerase I-like protein with 3'-5' exonuclease and polymerase domains
MRCSYQFAGPWTGRGSSNDSAFGSGTNLQNIADLMREMFSADPGWKLGNMDLKQAEAKNIAYLAEDENYIRACLSGDIHTIVAKLCWPELNWPADPAAARALAEQKFYREFSRRDLSKRGAHGSNYVARAWTIAKNLKIPLPIAVAFQTNYFAGFPGIPRYHNRVARELQLSNSLTTPLGRKLTFFGNPFSDDTLKQAVAGGPQSMTGDILNLGLWRMWKKFELEERGQRLQLLGQIHDAVLFQYRPAEEASLLPLVSSLTRIPTLVLEPELSTGWNWRKRAKAKDGTILNPNGLMEWTGHDDRSEPVYKTSSPLLARRVHS